MMYRILGAVCALCLAGAAQAATLQVLTNFDATTGGVLNADNSSITEIGGREDVCNRFDEGGSSAAGSALCGSDTDAGPITAETLTFSGIEFDLVRGISFSFAAQTISSGEFEPEDDPNSPSRYDFFTVTGNGTELARFEVDPSNVRALTSAIGTTSDDGTLRDFSISGSALTATGTGDLQFAWVFSGSDEYFALDTIQIEVVPLPFSAPLLLGGLALLGATRRRIGRT